MIIDDLKFVKLNSGDVKELELISKQTYFNAFSWGNSPENMRTYLEGSLSEKKLLKELKEANSGFYFAEMNHKTIGYFKINFGDAQTDLHDHNAMELERIYVIKEFQGKKIGQKLLDKVLGIAKKNQMDYLWLGVWEKNERAIRFYERNGFSVTGSHHFRMGDEIQTDLIMKLPLK
ncbi:MAG: GNAT family N-acetyltransferase [Flavobacteriaceae bacterium]|nr:GNAT family N-acetyltransferase [Flavobacteriaceae bacterium]